MTNLSGVRMYSHQLHHDRFWTSPVAFVGSLCVHALLAWLIITNLNSCGKKGDFGSAEVYREVGIRYETPPAEAPQEEPTPEAEVTAPELPALPELPDSMAEAPLTELPDLSPQTLIGPGPSQSAMPKTESSQAIADAIPAVAPEATAGIPSTTKFFEIATQGRVLLYVIDCSGSMSRNNSFRQAKSELMASLQRLDGTHKFQIIFYNDSMFEFRDNRGKPEIHWATAANMSRAQSFISEMDNSGGTAHFPALTKALSYSPEVIFFLTDAAEPAMSAKELDEIRRKNNGRAAIHCIEFGIQPTDLKLPNFLQKLAAQNGGTYRYRDTNEFGR